MQNQPTGYVDQAASHLLEPRGQLGWGGGGLALAILVGLAKNSDIGRVGKKMMLRRISLSTIFHDLKPELASKKWHYIFRRGRVDVLVLFGRSGPPA